MALFKIFNNANTKNSLPTTYNEGYCYFDVNTGKFYIDTIDDDADGRIPISGEMADKLRTPRTITLNGDVTGSTTFDGSSNVTITAEVAADSHEHNSQYLRRDGANQMTGDLIFSGTGSTDRYITFGKDTTNLWRVGYLGSGSGNANYLVFQSTKNSYDTWTDALKIENINLNATFAGKIIAPQGLQGNADTATAFKTAQTITVAGDATGSVTFDGTEAQTLSLDVGSADQLSSNYKINGTAFNGSKDITTASWGTARNVSITDGTNTGATTSMGAATSGSYSLKLPTTIKATLTGNASTATSLAKAVTIALAGDVSGSASFNGAGDITINAEVADDSHLHTKLKATGFGGNSSAAGLVPDAGGYAKFFYGFANSTPGSFPANNYANAILAISRHNNANYNSQLGFSSDGSIYYRAENGTAFTDETEWKKLAFTSDNVASADKWSTARTLTFKGGANGNVTFDGSKNVECEITITDDSHAHDTQYLRRDGANTMTGPLKISNSYGTTTDNNQGLFIYRNTNLDESVRHYVNDSQYIIHYTNDEVSNSVAFKFTNTDSENGDGTKASSGTITFYCNADSTTSISANKFNGNASSASKWQTARTITLTGGATGSVTIDGSADKNLAVTVTNDGHHHSNSTIDNLDASKITSGTISINRLPQGALERLVVVADDTARFKLTTSNVQLGDVVKVTATDVMYFVKDTANLGNANGYELFAAGRAASVNWANIENVPTLKLAGDATGEIALAGIAASGKVLNVTIADDSHAHNSQYLRRDGTNHMTGNITILTGDTDKFIEWKYSTSQYGASWRMGYLGSGSADSNYFVIQNTTSSTSTTAMSWLDIMKISMNTKATTFAGSVTATSFIGNASSASKLETAKTISLSGDVTGSTTFDGSGNVSISATVADDSHIHTTLKQKGGTSITTAVNCIAADGYITPYYNVLKDCTGLFPVVNNANTILAISKHAGLHDSQLGFSSNGSIYYRAEGGTAFTDSTPWKKLAFTSDNVASADKWSTARTLTLTGDVTGEVSFDGSGAISLTTTVTDDSHLHDGRYVKLAGSTLNAGAQIKRAGMSKNWISGRDGAALRITTINGYSPAISIKTVNGSWEIGAYDNNTFLDKLTFAFASDANYDAGTNTTNNYTIDKNGNYSGNSATASKWATARTITLAGDLTGSVSFDGSANATLTAAVADDSHGHDTQYVRRDGANYMTGPLTLRFGSTATMDENTPNPRIIFVHTDNSQGVALAYTANDSYRSPHGLKVIGLDGEASWFEAPKIYCTTLYGNATSASKWATARTITVAGDATGSVSIDGSANTTLTLDVATAAKTDHALTVNVTNVAGTTTTTTFNGSGAKTVNINASDFMPITEFTSSMKLTTSWQDITFTKKNGTTVSSTTLAGDAIAATGSYIIQILVNDGGTDGALSNYSEHYTGVLSWYSSGTNSTDTDEIVLHKAGHASNNRYIYLRTTRTSAGTLKMQIAANVTATANSTLVIKVRRLI